MRKFVSGVIILLTNLAAFPQAVENFLSDTSLLHASYSLCISDSRTGVNVMNINAGKSLAPASVLKLVTSAAAIELLGPYHTFTTTLGYTGTLTKSGRLEGDIVIKGGGDPAFASPYFALNYGDFPFRWVDEMKVLGIKKITGGIITDDSYYDYQPLPRGWIWEDLGNYYGAGVYGASIYDNTCDIYFNTSVKGTKPELTAIMPEECNSDLRNYLVAEGLTDRGYVFASPYSTSGWIAGTIPVNTTDFVLSASIPDPPLIFSKVMDREIREAGIEIGGKPSTVRIEGKPIPGYTFIADYVSPCLYEIIEVLNHESVNLYAEHLVKEMGKKYFAAGTAKDGLQVINSFLDTIGIKGMFIVDGSGLSPVNSINSDGLVRLLLHMKNQGRHFDYYLSSLPDAGKEGTLKNWFKDPVFDGCLKAKSGSMTRVRSYAGYFTAKSGREMAFAFMCNDFTGSSGNIAAHYEKILKEAILTY